MVIDYRKKCVRIYPLKAKSFEFRRTSDGRVVPTTSVLQAKKLLDSGCIGFLASIIDLSKVTELIPDDIPVARDYVSVFLNYLLGLHPDRKIVFSIDLVPKTTPIS